MILPPVASPFAWEPAVAGPALVCRALDPFARHLFTTGPWRLGSPVDPADSGAWHEVSAWIGAAKGISRLRQVHGNRVVRASDDLPIFPEADAITTDDRGMAVAVQAADCAPLLFVDRRTGAVAAAHAGWRGMALRVPRATIDAMARDFSTRPDDLIVAVGPSIGACCYEVGREVYETFSAAGFAAADLARWFFEQPQAAPANASMPLPPRRAGHWFFDGWACVEGQLEAEGVPRGQIFCCGLCTASHPDLLPSYRRDGRAAGRIAAAITPRRP